MYDPFGLLSDYQTDMPAYGMPQERTPIRPYKTPEEEQSALGWLFGKTMGGLGYAGGAFNKPGRVIRGTLGGNPREMLNAIPFSDFLGITKEDQQVTGEDLAKQWGLLEGEGEKGTFELRDLVGPAIEMGTDPLMFTGFGAAGAASRAGKAAQKIGVDLSKLGGAGRAAHTLQDFVTPANRAAAERAAAWAGVPLDTMLGEKLGGHIGFGLPFMTPMATADLSGPLGLAGSAAGGIGKLGLGAANLMSGGLAGKVFEGVKEPAAALGRSMASLFQGDLRGTTSELGQRNARISSEAASAKEMKNLEWLHDFAQRAKQAGIGDVRQAIETGQTHPLLDEFRQKAGELLGERQALGSPIGNYGPEYFPRQMTEHAGLKELTGGSAGRANPYSSFTPSQMHREFDQPTTLLNELFMDPQLVGNQAGIAGAQPYVAGKLGLTPQDIARHGQLKQQLIDAPGPKLETPPINTPIRAVYDEFAPLEKQMEQARVIAEHAATLDPQRAAKQLPYFGNAWDYDLQNYIKGQARATSNADQVINTIGEAAGAAGPYTIPIKDALNKIFPNATLELEGQLRSRFPQLGEFVPVDVVNELTRSIKGFQVPDALEKPISYIDKFTNLFKPWNTAPFPGYNIRNITTNWLKQFGLDISPVQLARNESLAGKITKGEFADLGLAGKTTNLGDGAKITIGGNPRFAHLGSTDEEIARKLADQSHIYGGAGGMTQTTDTLLPQSTRSIREAVPGETPWPGLGTTIKEGIPRNLEQANPFNVRGVNRESDVNSIIRAGRNVEQHYDAKSRLAGYISLIEQGYTPEAAGKYLQTAFPNYSGQSDFERNVMRRLVPFYSYARGSIPHELRQLAQKPGIQRVMAHEANALRQGDENFVPEYLGGGLAIPMGSEKEGTQRYLTGLGTPIEQALDWLHTGAKGPQASGLSLLAQMNPLIKGPLEMLTGKSFFTNRDAGDLYSTIQNTLGLDQKPTMLEQAVANSPASRIENTSRTLMDPRKSWLDAILNLGTGAKISDVDLEKQRDIAFREKAKAELEGDKGIGKFERLYLRSGAMPTPEQEAILRGQASVDKRMRKRAEEARKQRIAIMP